MSVMRSFLVKSPILGKASREEPIFPPLYAETLKEIDPEIGNCLAILSWRGGDEAIENILFDHCGVIIVYGSEETCNSVSKRVPPATRVISHSHRVGFGAVGREALSKKEAPGLAQKIAYDVSTFDQFACISPQVYFLEEGGEVSPKEFMPLLEQAMKAQEQEYLLRHASTSKMQPCSGTCTIPVSCGSLRERMWQYAARRICPGPSCMSRLKNLPLRPCTALSALFRCRI